MASLAQLTALALLLGPALAAGAEITGTVTLTGTPRSKDETFYARANGCGESPVRHTENWKVGPKGELADVVVWIVDPKFSGEVTPTSPPLPPIQIKQIGCRYVPHVIAVQAGVPFQIINGDPTLHNIRAKIYNGPGQPPGADVFNFGQSYQGQMTEQQFDDPGIYTLQCDVHAWMQAWVMALKSPFFAVTQEAGPFRISTAQPGGLVDGDYKMDAWHPRFAQTLEQIVHVTGGKAVVNFTFDGAKSF
jgi:plastocyanin